MRNRIVLVLVISFLASCTGVKKGLETNSDQPKVDHEKNLMERTDKKKSKKQEKKHLVAEGSWTFVFERSPCFGKCPWDQFTVFADGRIGYVGKRDVERIGTYSGRITADQAEGLKNYLEELGYFEMNEKYDSNISDLPSVQMNFYSASKKQEVYIRGDAPTGTTSIFNKMIEVYESVQDWEEVSPEEVPHNE